MVKATNLGFPRIGAQRQLKWATEAYWAGRSDADALQATAAELRLAHWRLQQDAGVEHIPSNDFSLYDHVLDTTVMLGAVPKRFRGAGLHAGGDVSLDCYFAMARGRAAEGDTPGVRAMEMTKWFDTNYHYIVPEFEADMTFEMGSLKAVEDFKAARAQGIETRPVLLGPVSYLLLGKASEGVDRLGLLSAIVPIYEAVLQQLEAAGADWIQIDEPVLTLDLTDSERQAFAMAYHCLWQAAPNLKLLLATYFGPLADNLETATSLPVQALHVDLTRGDALDDLLKACPDQLALSLGLIDGRNIWRNDLNATLKLAERAVAALGPDRVLVGPSCSLLHTPVDLDEETELDEELRFWMAYGKQKLGEIVALAEGLSRGCDAIAGVLQVHQAAASSRAASPRIHRMDVKQRIASVTPAMHKRQSAFAERKLAQKLALDLPELPTTTIGSFPQTAEIRKTRAAYRKGAIDEAMYRAFMETEIRAAVREQEDIGLDMLVHGEAERNDMVEYFGEHLQGFTPTRQGWVQSYGSRCVKPPVIYGDLSRTTPMTVDWTHFAQSCTDKPMKGMLTGPVTILQWSFVRDDQPRSETCKQIALAIRDEVQDLEAAGIRAIQIDEPALREGLPLRRGAWHAYLRWAVDAFRLSTAGVADATQIHTHMCYCAFNDIMDAIAALDADVISIEASRSDMDLLDAFVAYRYPNEIGPGIWDIHSPRVPDQAEMARLLRRALEVLSRDQIWVNPDCGLKTRGWPEVRASLRNLVGAAQELREEGWVPA